MNHLDESTTKSNLFVFLITTMKKMKLYKKPTLIVLSVRYSKEMIQFLSGVATANNVRVPDVLRSLVTQAMNKNPFPR